MGWDNSTFDGKEEVIADMIPRVRTAIQLKPRREISGDFVTDSWFFGARELIFKKDARLIFSQAAMSKRSELFVVAEKITIEDGVGTITCERSEPPAQGDRGQAPSGAPGQGDGANGTPGATGVQGITGGAGQNMADVTLVVSTLAGNGNLEVSTVGGVGGMGGRGQRGGDGGAGSQGAPARQDSRDAGWPIGRVWLPACASGPGQGGNGGSGGSGGQGGTGGEGGRGGTVTLASEPGKHQILTQAINVVSEGGAGGKPGEGGAGGAGGAAGPEGQLATFCNSAGRTGSPGAVGGTGALGIDGNKGKPGPQLIVSVEAATLSDWFGN